MSIFTDQEQKIAQQAAKIGRQCGQCSLCCKLLDVPEAGKEDGKWCPHVRPGLGGCSIYKDRPNPCRAYACAWLVTPLPDHWQPLHSHMIVDFHIARKDAGMTMRIHVDPEHPHAWRQEPYISEIRAMAERGATGKPRIPVVIKVGHDRIEVRYDAAA